MSGCVQMCRVKELESLCIKEEMRIKRWEAEHRCVNKVLALSNIGYTYYSKIVYSYLYFNTQFMVIPKYIILKGEINNCRIRIFREEVTEKVSFNDLKRKSDELIESEEFKEIFDLQRINKSKCLMLDLDYVFKLGRCCQENGFIANVINDGYIDIFIDFDTTTELEDDEVIIHNLFKYEYICKNNKVWKNHLYASKQDVYQILKSKTEKNEKPFIDDVLKYMEA